MELPRGNKCVATFCRLNNILCERAIERGQTEGWRGKDTQVHKEKGREQADPWFNPWVGKIPWRRKWLSTPVFLPGEPHGQGNLAGYSPWGHKRVRYDLATKQQRK